MRKISLIVCLMIAACAVQPDEDQIGIDEQAVVIPHTGPGVVTCWRSSAPAATCALTGGKHCNYAPSYGNVGSCTTTWSVGNSTTSCDGPEDCSSGTRCCANRRWNDVIGERYDAACQASACEQEGEYPLQHVTLCNPSLAETGCSAGQTCTRAGSLNPLIPFTVEHSGLQRETWFCKATAQ